MQCIVCSEYRTSDSGYVFFRLFSALLVDCGPGPVNLVRHGGVPADRKGLHWHLASHEAVSYLGPSARVVMSRGKKCKGKKGPKTVMEWYFLKRYTFIP